MPLYEYYCEKCGEYYEVLHPIDHVETDCPNCKANGEKGELIKLISSPSFFIH